MIPLYDHNPSRAVPVVTKTLLYANVFAFILQWWLESRGVSWTISAYGLVPSRVTADPEGEWFKAVSSMFLHANFAHLGWNMLFLHIFGDNVEDRLGKLRFVAFYLLAGVGAAAAQYLIDPLSPVPMIGASGAIAGVLGAYLVLYPRAPIAVVNPILPLWLLLGPLFKLPAWFVVGMWFMGNLFGGLASLQTVSAGGIAFFAHLGGFIAGLLLVRPLLTRSRSTGAHEPKRSRLSSSPRPSPERRIFWKDDGRPFWK